MMARDNGQTSWGVAFLTGAVIGAGTALLFAPYSGAKTRRLLTSYMQDAQDQVLDNIEEAREALDSALKQSREYINDKKSAIGSAFETGRSFARRAG